MIDKLMIFLICNFYKTIPAKRALVAAVLRGLPDMARRDIIEGMIPKGYHIHKDPSHKSHRPINRGGLNDAALPG